MCRAVTRSVCAKAVFAVYLAAEPEERGVNADAVAAGKGEAA
jgi:hypothetical protein